jgi:hypothetical protein
MNSTTISALKDFPSQFEQFFYAIPETSWQWSPESWEGIPSESFNAIEQICHVRDVEIDGYHIRFQQMLNETNPTLENLDGYALVQQNNYAQSDPARVLKDIRTARKKTLQLIENLTETELERIGYFEGYGQLTVKSLSHYLCSHDQQHLSGLQWLLGKIESNA